MQPRTLILASLLVLVASSTADARRLVVKGKSTRARAGERRTKEWRSSKPFDRGVGRKSPRVRLVTGKGSVSTPALRETTGGARSRTGENRTRFRASTPSAHTGGLTDAHTDAGRPKSGAVARESVGGEVATRPTRGGEPRNSGKDVGGMHPTRADDRGLGGRERPHRSGEWGALGHTNIIKRMAGDHGVLRRASSVRGL